MDIGTESPAITIEPITIPVPGHTPDQGCRRHQPDRVRSQLRDARTEGVAMTAGTQVVAYVRRSKASGRTDEERELSEKREEASIVAQRRAIQYAADYREYVIDPEHWRQDILSGKDLNRPGLKDALAMCDAGEVAAVMVATLDRLSRSSLDFEVLMRQADRRGWRILVADGNIDLSTADGRFMARVLMNAAQHEREKTSERTIAALAVKRDQGVVLGRRSGISEELRARIMADRLNGDTLQQIADTLNDERIPTAQGGDRWHPSTISQVLKSVRRPAPERAATAEMTERMRTA